MKKKAKEFLQGLLCAYRGFRFITNHKSLMVYSILPVLLSTGITVFSIFFLIEAYQAVSAIEFGESFFQQVASMGLRVGFIALSIPILVIVWIILNALFSSVFWGFLAKKTMLLLGVSESELGSISLATEVVDALHALYFLMVVLLVTFAVSVVPGIGPPLAFCIGMYWNSKIMAYELLDYFLALYGKKRSEKLNWLKDHGSMGFGFGLAAIFFQMIPFIGAIGLTSMVAGGALLVKDRLIAKAQ